MNSSSDEFSDSALDDSEEFEDSMIDQTKKREAELKNQPYDMALEVSASMDVGSTNNLMMNMGAAGGKSKEGVKVTNAMHDEEFEVSASMADSTLNVDLARANQQPAKGKMANQPYDEESQVSEGEESFDTALLTKKMAKGGQSSQNASDASDVRASQKSVQHAQHALGPQYSEDEESSSEEEDEPQQRREDVNLVPLANSSRQALATEEDDSEEESSSSEDEGEESTPAIKVEGAYDPAEYLHLSVDPEIKELFQYISRFKPQEPDLETVLKPFIPDYIPSVGEMDVFLKVPRPDGTQDDMGLKVLDEPASTQSDATVLELQLRAISKKQHGDIAVRSIEDAHKNPDQIQKWITSISDLHRSKPPPQVNYKNSMPDIETLMEIWPDEFEEALGNLELPGVDLDLSLEEYARVICTIMDIPVYDNIAESLHVLFTLFMEFKSNQHFMGFGAGNKEEEPQMGENEFASDFK